MITGAPAIICSAKPEADRAIIRDVICFPSVDAGGGWLIFALPRSELAFHSAAAIMCEDARALRQTLAAKGVEASAITDEGWGLLMHIEMPGGNRLGVYEARHSTPPVPA